MQILQSLTGDGNPVLEPMDCYPAMLQVDCASFDHVDAIWRMLTHAPDHDFKPVLILLNGRPHYQIIRTQDGYQTTAPAPAPLG
jgi:hypothetical protein